VAEAVEWVITHRDEASAMGLRGQELVRQRYGWGQIAKTMIGHYERALSRTDATLLTARCGR
jgi:hypothetical protein